MEVEQVGLEQALQSGEKLSQAVAYCLEEDFGGRCAEGGCLPAWGTPGAKEGSRDQGSRGVARVSQDQPGNWKANDKVGRDQSQPVEGRCKGSLGFRRQRCILQARGSVPPLPAPCCVKQHWG